MDHPNGSAVGMEAVAAKAGVTKATVSKVLGPEPHRYRISAATRERVETAARALGYSNDWRASHRTRPHARHIGLVMEWRSACTTDAYEKSLEHLAAALLRHDYGLVIVPDGPSLADWERQREVQRVDGIIALQPTACIVDNFVTHTGIPAIILNQPLPMAIDQVVADDAGGMHLAIRHLQQRGHEKILYIDGDEGNAHPSRSERRSAATTAAKELNLTLAVATLPLNGKQLLSVTAIVTYSHAEIPPLLKEIRQAGLKIGSDIAVVAGTDISAWSFMDPPISAIDVQMGVMITRAIDLLMQRISGSGPERAQRVKVAQRLHIRGSSDCKRG